MASLKSYGEWALVTGASAGIGTAFARELAAQSVNVVLVARRADRLEALAAELREKHGVKTRVVPEDLERDGAAERLLEWVRDLEIGILVNNAGFSMVGRFERVPREKILGMIRVNCLAVAALTHAFLPPMQARRRGAVIIVSSVAGYQPLGFAATYGATKAFDRCWARRCGRRTGARGSMCWHSRRGRSIPSSRWSPGRSRIRAPRRRVSSRRRSPRSARSRRSSWAESTRRAPGRFASRHASRWRASRWV